MRKKKFPSPKEDVPAWFMTYSDVVTLLMTFFILLLTFATMEPERFERVESSIANHESASGQTGIELNKPPKDSWVNRIRPNSSRIAMRGAKMPPITQAPVLDCFGKGIKALKENELKHNELETHYFDVELNQLVDSQGEITQPGALILAALAAQLRDLPFQAAIQYPQPQQVDSVIKLMVHLFEIEKVRPGQLAMTHTKKQDLIDERVRILVKYHLPKALE
jgi:flagellar motor protein MotB